MSQIIVDKTRFNKENLIELSNDELHYIKNVLRLQDGDELIVSTGTGKRYAAKLQKSTRKSGFVSIVKELLQITESPLKITLIQAIPRPKKMDLIIQKVTELGVNQIFPVITQRSFRPGNEEIANKWLKRWLKIAEEAARQSGRSIVPEISSILNYENCLSNLKANLSGIIFWEKEQSSNLKEFLQLKPNLSCINLLVGAEGGFTKNEISLSQEAGFFSMSLGNRILRTETASIVAVALTQSYWGDLPHPPTFSSFSG